MSRGSAPLPAADSLSRLLDQTLSLLEPHEGTRPGAEPAVPLPSLLARCESLLERSQEPVPARMVVGFGRMPTRAGAALLRQMPGLHLLPDAALGPAAGCSDPLNGFAPGLRAEAAAAAFDALDEGSRSRGTRLLLVHDARPGYDHLPASADSLLAARIGRRRTLAAVMLTDHPLLCWMLLHRQEGRVGHHPARLEDYAERHLAFLDAHPALPLVDAADILAEPENALRRITVALALDPDATLAQGVDRAAIAAAVAPPPGPPLQDADGRPATEEPLNTPAYLSLCARLGHEPERLPGHATSRAAPPPPSGPRRTLPRPAPGRRPAQISALLPRIDRLATSGDDGAPRLIGAAEVTAMIDDCLDHPDGFFERLDQFLAGLSPADGALLLCGCGAHYAAIGQPMHGIGLLAEAVELIPRGDRPLQLLAAELYLRMRRPTEAIALLLADARSGADGLAEAERALLDKTLAPLTPVQTAEHGHALLIERLEAEPPAPLQRRRVLIEIGTTRERVPGQGSTEKLAQVCAGLGIDFVTVDMDARNTAMARRMFRRLGLPFRAVTAKGEDFLAAWEGPIDYCFLDAYDFDHGMHSELRQSRYETFLGSRISDAQCHQMHLDCAHSLVKRLAPDGVICFDDTWTDEDGAWTAKGATAMPFLLDHGFKVIGARNRAALLVRG